LTVERVEREKFKYFGFLPVVQVQKLQPLKALEDERLPERLRQPLREWYEWHTTWYNMPVEIDIEPGVVRVVVFYDIEEELHRCEEACIKGAENKEEAWHGCYEECAESITHDLYRDIGVITSMLDKMLAKYGVRRGRVEYGWDNYTYWARYEIELD